MYKFTDEQPTYTQLHVKLSLLDMSTADLLTLQWIN